MKKMFLLEKVFAHHIKLPPNELEINLKEQSKILLSYPKTKDMMIKKYQSNTWFRLNNPKTGKIKELESEN